LRWLSACGSGHGEAGVRCGRCEVGIARDEHDVIVGGGEGGGDGVVAAQAMVLGEVAGGSGEVGADLDDIDLFEEVLQLCHGGRELRSGEPIRSLGAGEAARASG